MTKPIVVLGSILLSLGAAACGSSGPAGTATSAANQALAGPKVRVVATTTQVADFARVVGGDCVDVYGVLKPNVDPHDYEPSPADLDALARADVIVKNGVGLETWFDDTIASADSNATVVDASAGVALRPGGAGDPHGDPHIWQDPRNAEIMVANIADALAAAEPSCEADLRRQPGRLHRPARGPRPGQRGHARRAVPNKKLVTNHDAFGYYVDRYGLDFVGSIIPSFDSSAELSAHDITDLVDRHPGPGREGHLLRDARCRPRRRRPSATRPGSRSSQGDDALYGDTLGPAGSDGATYLADDGPQHPDHRRQPALRGLTR